MSRAFRLPNYTDLYYHDPANEGSPNLLPEKAWNYEAGADWHGSAKLRGSLTVFERRDTDLIDYVRTSASDIFRATNFDHLAFTGGEAEMEWEPWSGETFDAQYTGMRGDRRNDPLVVSKYVFNYPVHSGLVAWRGHIGKWIVGRTRIGVVERYDSGVYGVWDASAAWARGRVRPFVQLTDLTDTIYYEIPGVVMPRRGVIGGVELRTSR